MKFICLGYIEEGKWESMSEVERNVDIETSRREGRALRDPAGRGLDRNDP